MIDLLLHSGADHPELTWIVVAGVVALALGLALGVFSQRVRSWFSPDRAESPDRQ